MNDRLVQDVAAELALIAQRVDTEAGPLPPSRERSYLRGKANGLRFASEALAELVTRPKQRLRVVE